MSADDLKEYMEGYSVSDKLKDLSPEIRKETERAIAERYRRYSRELDAFVKSPQGAHGRELVLGYQNMAELLMADTDLYIHNAYRTQRGEVQAGRLQDTIRERYWEKQIKARSKQSHKDRGRDNDRER